MERDGLSHGFSGPLEGGIFRWTHTSKRSCRPITIVGVPCVPGLVGDGYALQVVWVEIIAFREHDVAQLELFE